MLHVYSDMSQRYGFIGYAACVLTLDEGYGGVDTIVWQTGELVTVELNNSNAAEIVATSIGVSLCHSLPPELIMVHTDLVDLPAIMREELVPVEKIVPYVDDLKFLLYGLRHVQFDLVPRENCYYRACHVKARLAASEAARRHGLLSKDGRQISFVPPTRRRRDSINLGGWPEDKGG